MVDASDLVLPEGLDFSGYDFAAAGEPHRYDDYTVGEKIDHVDGVTLTDSEHQQATRLWQNTAKVHFNTEARPDGRNLVYGGHVISLARALSFNGLANAQAGRGDQRGRAHRAGVRGRHDLCLVRGARQGRDVRAERGSAAPAAGGDQGPRRVDDPARRGRQVRRGRAARPGLLGAHPALTFTSLIR
ncbi:hypothetical protein [Nocardioides convexus]|uniref:hypothetical protein n=1 Tax=Nocardioides convexus TaxID=2712224 RepID=UPI0024187BCE|nr:hypothetical protein [Nocardioides convexus]